MRSIDPAINPVRHHLTSSNVDLRSGFANAIMATVVFKCWHLILFFSCWATAITLISDKIYELKVQTTLLTVMGTVLGFVMSYRTSSSFERYNEGRRYWSAIVLSSRMMARMIWFHVPDVNTAPERQQDVYAQGIVEKKAAINLVGAYAVAVKHYLRGEEGMADKNLYELLPGHMLCREAALATDEKHSVRLQPTDTLRSQDSIGLPFPSTTPSRSRTRSPSDQSDAETMVASRRKSMMSDIFHQRSLFPRTKVHSGKGGCRHAGDCTMNRNVPLEITAYLSSYISELQRRRVLDVPTLANLIANMNTLVESLTGLERIVTTPIPFSYSVHLWVVTSVFMAVLPFQLWSSLRYLTIPATAIATFVYFGFLVAGQEIENPFGHDKNHLNLDHFTDNIIRVELEAITSTLPLPISEWIPGPNCSDV